MSGLIQSKFQNFRKFPKIIPIDFTVVGAGGHGYSGYPNTGASSSGQSQGNGGGSGGNGGNGGVVLTGTASFWETIIRNQFGSLLTPLINVTVGAGSGESSAIWFDNFKTWTNVTSPGGAAATNWAGGTLVTTGSSPPYFYARNGSGGLISNGSNSGFSYVTGTYYGNGGAGGPAFGNGNQGAHGPSNSGSGGQGGHGGGNTTIGGPPGQGGSGFVHIRCKQSDFSSFSATGGPVLTTITISNVIYTLFTFNTSGTLRIIP